MGVIATRMMAVMEGSLAELATAVSAKFEIPQRRPASSTIGVSEGEGGCGENIPRHGDRLAPRCQFRAA